MVTERISCMRVHELILNSLRFSKHNLDVTCWASSSRCFGEELVSAAPNWHSAFHGTRKRCPFRAQSTPSQKSACSPYQLPIASGSSRTVVQEEEQWAKSELWTGCAARRAPDTGIIKHEGKESGAELASHIGKESAAGCPLRSCPESTNGKRNFLGFWIE